MQGFGFEYTLTKKNDRHTYESIKTHVKASIHLIRYVVLKN